MRADMMRVQVAFALFRFPWIALPASFVVHPFFFFTHHVGSNISRCIPVFHAISPNLFRLCNTFIRHDSEDIDFIVIRLVCFMPANPPIHHVIHIVERAFHTTFFPTLDS